MSSSPPNANIGLCVAANAIRFPSGDHANPFTFRLASRVICRAFTGACRSKRNLLPIFRPVKSSDIRLLLRQLPSLAALRRNHPNLSSGWLPFSLFFLVFPFLFVRFFPFGFFLFRRGRGNNRARFPLRDKCQPPPIWRPFRRVARLLSSRQLKAHPASHFDQPDLPHIRVLLPIRFPDSICDKPPVRRYARASDRLQIQGFLKGWRMLRLCRHRPAPKNRDPQRKTKSNRSVH